MGKLYQYVFSTCLLLGVSYATHALENADNLIHQAQQTTEAGRLNEAQAMLLRAIELAPASSLARTRLGGIQLLQQNYTAGIDSFQQAIMLDHENADAFIGMSIAYLHMGRYSLAREALNEASRLAPTKQQEIDTVLAWLDQRDQPSGH